MCILKGSYIFCSDLSRALSRYGLPNCVEFMCVSSYAGAASTGTVRIVMDLRRDIYGHHVLLVEDIHDSGRTLEGIQKNLLARGPTSLSTAVLLEKPSRHLPGFAPRVDWVGFEIPDKFVVGYGLDYNETRRELPYVAVLKPALYAAGSAAPAPAAPAPSAIAAADYPDFPSADPTPAEAAAAEAAAATAPLLPGAKL